MEKLCEGIVKKEKEEKEKEEEAPVKPDVEHLKTVAGVPDFWYRAIKNNHMVADLVKEKDEEILKGLRHVETEKTVKPQKTLTVKFHFVTPNTFFTNSEPLQMKVFYRGDEDDVEKIEGTEIKWNEGMDPTKKKVKKKQKHKKTNETRTIVKTVETESFFNVFTNRVVPDESANMESDEENELHDKIDMAMNLAEDMDDVMIPDALEYYLGLNDDLLEGMGDEEDEEGDGDDEEGDDGDNDEDKKGKKKKEKKEGAPAAGDAAK